MGTLQLNIVSIQNMRITHYIYIIAAVMLAFCATGTMKAQNAKAVTVADGQSYAESISLKKDSRDMDMILKIVFDEPANSLVVSLVSYRNLLVFHDNVRYKQVARHSKLRPKQFPYVVESDPKMQYKLTGEIKDQMPGCHKNFVFYRWLNYEGLQPQPTDYKMVNDYIEQRFDITDKDTLASISLHDILVMEPSEKKRDRFNVFYLARLNLKYDIRIVRNPCLGKEEDIEAARLSAETIRNSYETMYQSYISTESRSHESLATLNEMRELLEQQFPKRTESSPCPTVREYIREYNCYVDSIKYLKDIQISIENERPHMPLPAERIMYIAKIIDMNVSKWLISSDTVEKEDIIKRSKALIDEVNMHLDMDVVLDEEQQMAVDMYLKAERYFNAICAKTEKK